MARHREHRPWAGSFALGALLFGCAPETPAVRAHQAALAAGYEPDGELTLTTTADYAQKRGELVTFIWGSAADFPKGLPATVTKGVDVSKFLPNLRNLKRADDLLIQMEAGESTVAHHLIASRSKNRLVVFNPGHLCTYGDTLGGSHDYGEIQAIDALLADGFSVLAMHMPHYDESPPGMCPIETYNHNMMFDTIQVAKGSVMKFFVEPVMVSLNYLQAKSASDDFPAYTGYDMIGLSGGGWTTALSAAIDPRIGVSVPVAGSLPLYTRDCAKRMPPRDPKDCYLGYMGRSFDGDAEQDLPTLYADAVGYLDIYALGAQGTNRRQVQVSNRKDDCCFGEAQFGGPGATWDSTVKEFAARVKAAVAKTNAGSYDFIIDEAATKHQISSWAVKNVILPELNRSAAVPDAGPPDSSRVDSTVVDSPPASPPDARAARDAAVAIDAETNVVQPTRKSGGGGCIIGRSSGGAPGLETMVCALATALVIGRRRRSGERSVDSVGVATRSESPERTSSHPRPTS